MAADRDAIFQALLARMRPIDGLVTVGDRLVPWSQCSPGSQPALFIVKGPENPETQRGLPPKWNLTANLYLYCHASSRKDMSAQRQLNRLLTLIESALERQPGEDKESPEPFGTTLGGLVSHAWIDGPVQTDEGSLGDQSVAVVPVSMLTTG